MDLATADLLLWLRERSLTTEDLTASLQDAARERGRAPPQELVAAVLDEYGFASADEARVQDVLRLAVFSEEIVDNGDGTYSWPFPPVEYITALVRVPVGEWDRVKPYLARGRPAWVSAA